MKNQVREGNNQFRENTLNSIEGLCYFRPLDAIDIFNHKWLISSDATCDVTFEELRDECTAILIPEFDYKDKSIEYIRAC